MQTEGCTVRSASRGIVFAVALQVSVLLAMPPPSGTRREPPVTFAAGADAVSGARGGAQGAMIDFSTYLGGRWRDEIRAVSVDVQGNVYVTGATNSPDFPLAAPLQGALAGGDDAFVAKIDPVTSRLVWATYLGGSDMDTGLDVAVDAQGGVYVFGATASADFPVASPLQAYAGAFDAFVTRLDPSGGALVFSTYFGGSDAEWANAGALDAAGNAHFAGSTFSTDLPLRRPLQAQNAGCDDAFVAALDASGTTLVHATYLGGSACNAPFITEAAAGIQVLGAGSVLVAGWTQSSDFPTLNAFQLDQGLADGFVARLETSGPVLELAYATYLGGSGEDGAGSIAVDATGRAAVSGATLSTDFPTLAPLQPSMAGCGDGFVTTLSPDGQALFSTYLGGSADCACDEFGCTPGDRAGEIAIAPDGALHVAGITSSLDFPTRDALQSANAGFEDTFLSVIEPERSRLLFSTYLGGPGMDRLSSLAIARSTVVVGGWAGEGFPCVRPIQGSMAGAYDAALARIVFPRGNVLVGQGHDASNRNGVELRDGSGNPTGVAFDAYGAGQWGANVASGSIRADAIHELLTAPGPGPGLGPQVRGWSADGVPIAKVSFYAYGTLRFGSNVAGAELDVDAFDDMLTGAGPGAVFGPHVRGFESDALPARPLPRVSFFAYGTPRFGVGVAGGDVDGAAAAEILTGAGPGPTFTPHVRGFGVGPGGPSPLPGLGFEAYPTPGQGVVVGGGDFDGDAGDDIATAPGPGPSHAARFRGFARVPGAVAPLPGFDLVGYPGRVYGGRVGSAELSGDWRAELLTGAGPDPAADATVATYAYDGQALAPAAPTFLPFAGAYGVNVSGAASGW